MFDRIEIKQQAKHVLAGCYWVSFAVALILAFIGGGTGLPFFPWSMNASVNSGSSNVDTYTYRSDSYTYGGGGYGGYGYHPAAQFFSVILFVILWVSILMGIALSIFVYSPLTVGGKRFFVRAGEGYEVKFANMGYCFKNGYWNVVKTMFMKNLFIFLWSLIALVPIAVIAGIVFASWMMRSMYTGAVEGYALYIRELFGFGQNRDNPVFVAAVAFLPMLLVFAAMIPAIIAQYRYLMVEYLLAENPYLPWREALNQSKRMMEGNKWAAFVLHLSFLGWMLLGACACGLGILFVNPYVEAANAQLYIYLKNRPSQQLGNDYIPYV